MAKVSGLVFLDGKETGETKQCVHCGRNWVWVKGSGRVRGYCMACGGITCGNRECNICTPWQKKMEEDEKAALKRVIV